MRALAVAVALLGAWQAYVVLGGIDRLLLPAPSDIARSLYVDRGLLWAQLRVTAFEVLLGIAAALVTGVACAVGIHLSTTLRRTTQPLLVASQALPIPIVAPVLVAWLGFDLAPKVAIVGLVCFFPVAVATVDGLRRADPELRKLMRTLGASRLQTLRRVEVPTALPSLVSGTRIAVAVAVIGAVLAEQAGASSGLGHLMLQAIPQFETARAFAAVVLLSALAILLFASLTAAERRLLPWAHPPKEPTP